jgi:hypothetical protein
MQKRFTRLEATKALGVSLSTFDRWIRTGKLTPEYGEKNRLGKTLVFVTLDVPDEAPQTEPEPVEVAPAPAPEPVPERALFEQEQQAAKDARFAALYKAGRATDSVGNTVNGTNKRFPVEGSASLIGPASSFPKPQKQPHKCYPTANGRHYTDQQTKDEPVQERRTHAQFFADYLYSRGLLARR